MVDGPRGGQSPTWATLIREGSYILSEAGVPSPTVDARALAEFVAGERPNPTARPGEAARRFLSLIGRRAQRIPLQHLTGRMYFRYLTLASTPAALVVRPETEMVAGAAIAAVRERVSGAHPHPTALDLGTGSGAIALAIATEVPPASVTGVDISAPALQLAQRNNAAYGTPVHFVEGDALDPALATKLGRYDVVVSNPPYVPPGSAIAPEATHDPALALWGGSAGGMEFPAALVRAARALLVAGGRLIVEHDERQGAALRAVAKTAGYTDIVTRQDLTARDRWLEATWPGDTQKGEGC
ncbi:peptide chain release factor N(5)-glutamine methyltransferase [Neoactinobaculum massilliense]|uniref:peptide chain release factor N(5)-glutamine methyltransferase n=1 Tax=Neoactinobaculum massilliense TaxID=2364794 RepID=UPI000F51B8E1|nr:peptide chain release factor N(5)-glutamine methyltransferase [Neoactinobaculum massilliense]